MSARPEPKKGGYYAVLELGFDSWEELAKFRTWLWKKLEGRGDLPDAFDLTDYPEALIEAGPPDSMGPEIDDEDGLSDWQAEAYDREDDP